MNKGKSLNYCLSLVKKSRSQIFTISVLCFLAAIFMSTVFFLLFDYKKNFLREREKLVSEDIDILYTDITDSPNRKSDFEKVLSGIEGIDCFEVDEVITAKGTVPYNDGFLSKNITLLDYDTALEKRSGNMRFWNPIKKTVSI